MSFPPFYIIMNFNPRARKERDLSLLKTHYKHYHFNPRARKERDLRMMWASYLHIDFNPRARKERDSKIPLIIRATKSFQSTRP